MKILFFCIFTVFYAQFHYGQESTNLLKNIQLKNTVFCLPAEDQSNSPTCWAFGTNSLIASDIWKINKQQINFSEMFLARYAYIDKAAKFLATGGKTYFEGGGTFHDVIRVIQQHGIVPESVYSGKVKKNLFHDHTKLDTAMQKAVRRMLINGKKSLTQKDITLLNDTLDKYLGKTVKNFIYNSKKYTPGSFAKEKIPFIQDYLELVSFSNQKLYAHFILKDKYNWANDRFYNVSLQDLEMIADTAIYNGWSLGWEGDVTNSWFKTYEGLAQKDSLPKNMDEKRVENYKSEFTVRDHMLHIVGSGTDHKGKKWYYTKNSWGKYNKYDGYLYMDLEYFKYNLVILFVHKKALPESLRQKLHLN